MTLSNSHNAGNAAPPQKRPLENDAEGGPQKKKNGRSEATKAARAEEHARREQQKQDAYSQVASEIAPMVAAFCDSYGGCTSMGLVMQDPEILEALERVPEGCSKKMKKILELYPDYIVMLPESGYLCTALAYDNGVVSTSGEINKEVLKENWKRKKEEDKKNGTVQVQPVKKKGGNAQQEQGGKVQGGGQASVNLCRNANATSRLEDACADLYDAAMESSQSRVEAAWEAVNAARKEAFFVGLPGFLDLVRQFMVGKGLQAGQQIKMQEINNNNDIKNLYNEIPQKDKKKVHKLLTDCKEWFEISVEEKGGVISVALTPEGARGPKPNPNQRLNQNRGGDRGGRGGDLRQGGGGKGKGGGKGRRF